MPTDADEGVRACAVAKASSWQMVWRHALQTAESRISAR
jgi:hypothetical protein